VDPWPTMTAQNHRPSSNPIQNEARGKENNKKKKHQKELEDSQDERSEGAAVVEPDDSSAMLEDSQDERSEFVPANFFSLGAAVVEPSVDHAAVEMAKR
jgi:hypothetical protein